MPKAKTVAPFNDPRAMQCFEDNVQRLALEESEVGARCRLALRLRRDNAPASKQKRAIAPILRNFVKLLMLPEDKLTRGDDGDFLMPVHLPKRKARENAA